jgi:preprotein translocase subunit SecA
MLDDAIESLVDAATMESFPEEWDLAGLWKQLSAIWPVSIDVGQYDVDRAQVTAVQLLEDLQADAHAAYDKREETLGEEVMRDLERRVTISVLDRRWREHLYEMDYLKEGIHLRSFGQKDPVVEYQREGFDMFSGMLEGIKEEAITFIFNVDVQIDAPQQAGIAVTAGGLAETGPAVSATPVEGSAGAAEEQQGAAGPFAPDLGEILAAERAALPTSAPDVRVALPEGFGAPKTPARLEYSAPAEDGGEVHSRGIAPSGEGALGGRQQVGNAGQAIGHGTPRNAPCPCGSGRKYKKCHGAPGAGV